MAEKKYIERNEAVKTCEDYFKDVCVYDVDNDEVINDFERILDSVPVVDVTPIRHGHWILAKRTKIIPTDKIGLKENFITCKNGTLVDENNINKKVMIIKKTNNNNKAQMLGMWVLRI